MRALRLGMALVVVSTTAAFGFQSSSDPTHELDPDLAGIGSTIVSSGEGWTPAATIDIFLDRASGESLGSGVIGKNGAFKVEWQVPKGTDPGRHEVIACEAHRPIAPVCARFVRANLTVDPAVTTTTTKPPVTTTRPPATTTTTTTKPPTTTAPSTTSSSTTPPTATSPPTTSPDIGTAGTTTTSSRPPIAAVTTTTVPGGPDDVTGPSTTLGGDPTAPPSTIDTFTDFPDDTSFDFTPNAPTGGPIENIAITSVEVTQVLQDLDNDFPLVEHRWTAVRIHGMSEAPGGQPWVSGAVEVIRQAPVAENLGIFHSENLAFYSGNLIRKDLNSAPYVLLDPDIAFGTLLIRAWVYANDDGDASNEDDQTDNLMEVTVEFHDTETVYMRYYPIYMEEDFGPDGPSLIWTAGDGWLGEHMFTYRMWPVENLIALPKATVIGDSSSNFDLSPEGSSSGPNLALAELKELEDLPGNHLYSGMLHPDFDATAKFDGFASAGTTWTIMGQSYWGSWPWYHESGATLAHESGHFFGLDHAPCLYNFGEAQPGEVPGGAVDPTFPGNYGWPDCKLAPEDPEGYYGFDALGQITPTGGPTVISNDNGTSAPNVAWPFMGYVSPKWLDPWHGCFILDQLGVDCAQNDVVDKDQDSPTPDGNIPTPGVAVPAFDCFDWDTEIDLCNLVQETPFDPTASTVDHDWLVSGVLDLSDPASPRVAMRAASIEPTRNGYHAHLDGRTDLGGPYVLALLGPDGAALWATTIHVEDHPPIDDGTGPPESRLPFVMRVPAIDGASGLAIVSPGGTVGDLRPSNAPPVLAVVGVTGGDTMVIDLETSDPDGDVVWTAALYRPDESSNWTAVSPFAATDHIALLDTSDLAGSENGLVKVVATDGWHTVERLLPGIRVPEHPPLAMILQPATGSSYRAGRPVRLEAQATDSEDGVLPDGAFTWTSDRDGALGAGSGLTLFDLSEGVHVITVVAADSSDRASTDSVTIRIDPSDLPSLEVRESVARAFTGSGDSGPPIAVVVAGILAVLAAAGGGAILRARRLR